MVGDSGEHFAEAGVEISPNDDGQRLGPIDAPAEAAFRASVLILLLCLARPGNRRGLAPRAR